jgi:hypothetical protein
VLTSAVRAEVVPSEVHFEATVLRRLVRHGDARYGLADR